MRVVEVSSPEAALVSFALRQLTFGFVSSGLELQAGGEALVVPRLLTQPRVGLKGVAEVGVDHGAARVRGETGRAGPGQEVPGVTAEGAVHLVGRAACGGRQACFETVLPHSGVWHVSKEVWLVEAQNGLEGVKVAWRPMVVSEVSLVEVKDSWKVKVVSSCEHCDRLGSFCSGVVVSG